MEPSTRYSLRDFTGSTSRGNANKSRGGRVSAPSFGNNHMKPQQRQFRTNSRFMEWLVDAIVQVKSIKWRIVGMRLLSRRILRLIYQRKSASIRKDSRYPDDDASSSSSSSSDHDNNQYPHSGASSYNGDCSNAYDKSETASYVTASDVGVISGVHAFSWKCRCEDCQLYTSVFVITNLIEGTGVPAGISGTSDRTNNNKEHVYSKNHRRHTHGDLHYRNHHHQRGSLVRSYAVAEDSDASGDETINELVSGITINENEEPRKSPRSNVNRRYRRATEAAADVVAASTSSSRHNSSSSSGASYSTESGL